LSIIPTFFITRKITGNLGAFFASMIVAINVSLLSRTIGGFSDTDTYNIICPLLITFFLFEAYYAKKQWQKFAFTIASGFSVFLYQIAWGGWFYIFDFVLAMQGLYFIYLLVKALKAKENKFKSIIEHTTLSLVFFLSSLMFMGIFTGLNPIKRFIEGPLWVIGMKSVGVSTILPNVLTTVAEFNVQGYDVLVNAMGGRLFVLIALIGIAYSFFKDKRYALLLIIWLVGTSYAFTKGTRFSILSVPAFAIAFGIGIHYLYTLALKLLKSIRIDKYVYTKIAIVCLFLVLLLAPLKAANVQGINEIPSMNDAWFDSLIEIKNDCEDGIITSWWDFGHWFYTISKRRVTFDGGDQNTRVHWVGKTLLTEEEDEAINILRMLNCGQNSYYENLVKFDDDEKGAIDAVKEGISQGEYTCDYLPQYFIVSTDMIGKSGVWAHFGSWDFDRAIRWQEVRKGNYEGITEDEKYEILNTPADQWIAPWPSYGQSLSCVLENKSLNCNGLIIYQDMTTNSDKIKYISYADNGTFVKKELNENGEVSLIVAPNGVLTTDNRLAGSMFTKLYFFEGIGTEKFELLSHKTSITGQEIYTYKVNLND